MSKFSKLSKTEMKNILGGTNFEPFVTSSCSATCNDGSTVTCEGANCSATDGIGCSAGAKGKSKSLPCP